MLLALNIGNSETSFALFESAGSPVAFSYVSTQKHRSVDEYVVLIKQILDFKTSANYKIDRVAISSVVPSITSTVSSAAEIISDSKPYIIGPGIKTGFKIAINDPACLGADIVANTAATIQLCDGPFIIFDAGTANTVTVVDGSHTLIGMIIIPGIGISASALSDSAELLDPVFLNNNDIPLIGKTTNQSIRSGLINGSAIMLDGIVRNIRESLIHKNSDTKLGLIATGTYSGLITANCRNKFTLYDDLTLRGIASLYFKNTKNQQDFV